MLPSAKAFSVPRAYLDTVLLMPPHRPLSVVTGTATLVSTSTAAAASNIFRFLPYWAWEGDPLFIVIGPHAWTILLRA